MTTILLYLAGFLPTMLLALSFRFIVGQKNKTLETNKFYITIFIGTVSIIFAEEASIFFYPLLMTVLLIWSIEGKIDDVAGQKNLLSREKEEQKKDEETENNNGGEL